MVNQKGKQSHDNNERFRQFFTTTETKHAFTGKEAVQAFKHNMNNSHQISTNQAD